MYTQKHTYIYKYIDRYKFIHHEREIYDLCRRTYNAEPCSGCFKNFG